MNMDNPSVHYYLMIRGNSNKMFTDTQKEL